MTLSLTQLYEFIYFFFETKRLTQQKTDDRNFWIKGVCLRYKFFPVFLRCQFFVSLSHRTLSFFFKSFSLLFEFPITRYSITYSNYHNSKFPLILNSFFLSLLLSLCVFVNFIILSINNLSPLQRLQLHRLACQSFSF